MSVADVPSTQSDLKSQPSSSKKKWGVCGFAVLIVAAAIGVFCWPNNSVTLPASVSSTEYEAARREFAELFHREPNDADLMMLLAETAVRNEQLDRAIDCFERVPSDNIRYGASARLQEAQALLRRNDAEKAEASFRAFLELAETQPSIPQDQVKVARDWLVFMLAVELRFEDRKAILQTIIQDGRFDVYDAKQYYFPALLIWQSNLGSSRLREFLEKTPADRLLRIADARYLVGEGKLDAASQLLETLRKQYPGDLTIIAATLECLYEQVNWKQFKSIVSTAPGFQDNEPWLLTQMRAQFALQSRDWPAAEKYFQQVLKADPANPTCHMGLAMALGGLGKTEDQKIIRERSLILARIRVRLSAVNQNSAAEVRALSRDASHAGLNAAAHSFELLAEHIERGAH